VVDDLLEKIAPSLRCVRIIYDQNIPANVERLRNAEAASALVGMTIKATELHSASDIERALTDFAHPAASPPEVPAVCLLR